MLGRLDGSPCISPLLQMAGNCARCPLCGLSIFKTLFLAAWPAVAEQFQEGTGFQVSGGALTVALFLHCKWREERGAAELAGSRWSLGLGIIENVLQMRAGFRMCAFKN